MILHFNYRKKKHTPWWPLLILPFFQPQASTNLFLSIPIDLNVLDMPFRNKGIRLVVFCVWFLSCDKKLHGSSCCSMPVHHPLSWTNTTQ